ncbi:MAG TPA: CorA family divalent cation transporter [Candidatus Limnocylindrales bacterium]|jgi:Mg2+ and Co2+ transporter CorA
MTTKRMGRRAAPKDPPPRTRPAQAEGSTKRPATGADADATRGAGVRVRLFDSDRTDEELELAPALDLEISDRQLLWIDLEGATDEATMAGIAKRMELAPTTRRALGQPAQIARLALHGTYFHVRVATEADREPSESPHWLDLVAGANVVLTSHAEPVAFLRDLNERVEADASVGAIDAPAFVATALDAAVTSYFKSVDEIEQEVERLDRRALQRESGDDVLAELVELRRRIGRLRRVLSDERDVFAAFRAADFGAVAPDDDAAAFQALADRFESALASVEQSRDLLLGSFDIFMTRTAQRTNEVMKILALATVLLLPGSLIAGLLGMNVSIPLPNDNPASFWLVLATIVVLALGVLVFARSRRWI